MQRPSFCFHMLLTRFDALVVIFAVVAFAVVTFVVVTFVVVAFVVVAFAVVFTFVAGADVRL